mmetsp:Transcript_6593/g.15231  ORF Transcript_6593/g.15231 Transcript_6593/m.15231 type:complete len:251 (-) Transcript_6593:363-1115(-)
MKMKSVTRGHHARLRQKQGLHPMLLCNGGDCFLCVKDVVRYLKGILVTQNYLELSRRTLRMYQLDINILLCNLFIYICYEFFLLIERCRIGKGRRVHRSELVAVRSKPVQLKLELGPDCELYSQLVPTALHGFLEKSTGAERGKLAGSLIVRGTHDHCSARRVGQNPQGGKVRPERKHILRCQARALDRDVCARRKAGVANLRYRNRIREWIVTALQNSQRMVDGDRLGADGVERIEDCVSQELHVRSPK